MLSLPVREPPDEEDARMFHRHHGLPEGWQEIVERCVAVWQLLDDDERAAIESDSDWLLRHKHWEAANGFALTDEILVTVAVQAALVVLGLTVDEYREVSAIVVYPSAMVAQGVSAGPVMGTVTEGPLPILGQAHDRRGPVLLAWDQARRSSMQRGSGHNVVYHEFAHKLDMLDQLVDGTPPFVSPDAQRHWVEVCTAIFQSLRAGNEHPPLDGYAATNPAEFFAVATEAFFDAPTALEAHEPELYTVLRDYYQQDPAARELRQTP
jgi:Mlc titration factor MtfA (ptsG expression regulator)